MIYICDYCQTTGAEVINKKTGFIFHRDCAKKYEKETSSLSAFRFDQGNYDDLKVLVKEKK